MKTIRIVLLVLIIIGVGLLLTQKFWVEPLVDFILEKEKSADPTVTAYADLIEVEKPGEGEVISSPFVVEGRARGTWYFEATFPIVLVDWDGRIIAESYAQAEGEWMTENFVAFKGTLEFESPYKAGDPDFMKRGAIIFKKDNPSGLPQNDAALEIPIIFEN